MGSYYITWKACYNMKFLCLVSALDCWDGCLKCSIMIFDVVDNEGNFTVIPSFFQQIICEYKGVFLDVNQNTYINIYCHNMKNEETKNNN